MNFYNLIKFRKLFLVLMLVSAVYLLRKFAYLSESLESTTSFKETTVEIKPDTRTEQLKRKHPDKIAFGEHLRVSKYAENCGNTFKCGENEFCLFLNTGIANKIYPKLCIDEKFLPDRLFNRGLNVVIIDNTTKTVSTVQNYDTHLKDSTNLETQLLSLRPGDKIVLFTFDEAPKLSKVAKLLINELGSVHIQNVQFRTSWYLVSEKQIKGYSPFEEIHLHPAEKGQLASPHTLRLCIPFQIKGDFVRVDQSLFGNKDRVEYCRQFRDKWKGFCDDNVVNEPLYVSSPTTAATASSPLQRTPILVFSALSDENDLLSLTLETVFRQTGVLPGNVLVFYFQESTNELQMLAQLFRFKSQKIDPDHARQWFNEIRSRIEKEFLGASPAKQFILIFGNLILTADFLNYYSQLVPLLWYPSSRLSFVSTWNDQCYNSMCTDEKLVTRVQGDKFSFKHSSAVKYDRDFFSLLEKIIQLNCFGNQSIRFDDLSTDGLVPDFPRIIAKENSDLFLDQSNDQKVSLLENVKINRIESLYSVESYEKSLLEFQENSLTLRGERELAYYMENQHNNTSVNITVLTSPSGLPEICTVFRLRSCLCNYHLDALGETLRFNFNRHLSVLLISN